MSFKYSKILGVTVIALGLMVSTAVVLHAQSPSDAKLQEKGITFPIEELGNCSSKADCRDYCDQPENMKACMDFAREHDLADVEQAQKAEKFARALSEGGGPGGCQTPSQCMEYCSVVDNLEECVEFSEKNELGGANMQEARKILNYVEQGGEMPGGCNSRMECQQYCSNPDHMEECIEFAKEAGLQGAGKADIEQMRKFSTLMEQGETPGGCQSHAECREYCNDPANSQECFEFAKKNGLVSEQDVQRMEQGAQRMVDELERIPEEVRQCVEDKIGPDRLSALKSGDAMPGRELGQSIRECFKASSPDMNSGPPRSILEGAPEEVISCVTDNLNTTLEEIRAGNFDITQQKRAINECARQINPPDDGVIRHEPPQPSQSTPLSQGIPEELKQCLREESQNYSITFEQIMASAEARSEQGDVEMPTDSEMKELISIMRTCMQNTDLQMMPQPGGGAPQPEIHDMDESQSSIEDSLTDLLGVLLAPFL